MNRNDYRAARKLYRENGRYSLRWMTAEARATVLLCVPDKRCAPADWLRERVWLRENMGAPFLQAAIRQDGRAHAIRRKVCPEFSALSFLKCAENEVRRAMGAQS